MSVNWKNNNIELINLIYPVGSVYITFNSNINPSSIFGGVWESINNKFLYLVDKSSSSNVTGGESEHKLTVDEMPEHDHSVYFKGYHNIASGSSWKCMSSDWYVDDPETPMICEKNGSNQPHNNMPPYITCYGFVRIS